MLYVREHGSIMTNSGGILLILQAIATSDVQTTLIDGKKMYLCPYCAKPFLTRAYIKTHVRAVHTESGSAVGGCGGVQPSHECGGCGKLFKWKQSLAKHIACYCTNYYTKDLMTH